MSRVQDIAHVTTSAIRASHADCGSLEKLQMMRLNRLVRRARIASPYFRDHLRDVPDSVSLLTEIPSSNKRTLMSVFEHWVTDPRLKLDRLRIEFLDHPELVGRKYLGRYRIFTTSGTTGEPAVIILDPTSWLVMQLVSRLRIERQLMRHGAVSGMLKRGFRSAVLFATGGHYGGVGLAAALQSIHPVLRKHIHIISVLDPIETQVARLNAYQPTYISGYPSALLVLAAEQRAGRLFIRPAQLLCAGEYVSEQQRSMLESTFGCHLLQGYAASEAPALALECDAHRFHVNADWYLIEPVDGQLNPVSPGTTSHSCLVTNLANFVQPIIRYDLGDRITMYADPCSCGSRLPSLSVEGRTNDVIEVAGKSGNTVTIVPLAIASLIEEVHGVERLQVVNPDARTIHVRLETSPTRNRDHVEREVASAVSSFLHSHGAREVAVSIASESPHVEPSGKLRQVIRP